MKDDIKNLPLRCESHADCGWAEYCGWVATEFEQKELTARCQACVGCVEPEQHNGNSQYFVAYGVPLAPVTGKCPDCDERARVGEKNNRPPEQKIVKKVDVNVDELRKQKQALERELDETKGSIYDASMAHQAKEQALQDELDSLRKKVESQKAANVIAPTTTSTTTTTTTKGAKGAGGFHTYNTYNIYNTYNTQNTYNSNGHTFNSWSSCENVTQPMPMGVTGLFQAHKQLSALIQRRQPFTPQGLPTLPPTLELNCTEVPVVD